MAVTQVRRPPPAPDHRRTDRRRPEPTRPGRRPDSKAKIAACDRKLTSYRTALDADGDPVAISRWINEVTAERARYKAQAHPAAPRAHITLEQIAEVVTALGGILAVLRYTELSDKAEAYSQLGLGLTYQPGLRIVQAEARLGLRRV